MNLGLPPLSQAAAPEFSDAAACRTWLQALPLANPPAAQTRLIGQLEVLNRYDLPAARRLELMELLRKPAGFVQTECARRFSGRPLPLAQAEQLAFDGNRALWSALATGYRHVLRACLDGDAEVQPHTAMVVQRALSALGAEQIDCYLAPHDAGPAFWRQVHTCYGAAEGLNVSLHDVPDRGHSSSPFQAYLRIVLLHAASPYELSPRNVALASRWLGRWAHKVKITRSAPQQPKLPPLVVDLAGERPAGLEAEGAELRWLDVEDIARSIRKRLNLIQQGVGVDQLGLGEDCPAEPEPLLRHLYERLCKGNFARLQQRRSTHSEAALWIGAEAIYLRLAGEPFMPERGGVLSRQQAEELATLGHRSSRQRDELARDPRLQARNWRVLDQSPAGLRIACHAHSDDPRIAPGTLVAVQVEGDRNVLLGCIRWALVAADGALTAGCQIMPGVPEAAMAWQVGPATPEQSAVAFMLPPLATLKIAPSVVLPQGWHKLGRSVEVSIAGTHQRLRLGALLERGASFDRAEYQFDPRQG